MVNIILLVQEDFPSLHSLRFRSNVVTGSSLTRATPTAMAAVTMAIRTTKLIDNHSTRPKTNTLQERVYLLCGSLYK